MKILSHRGYWKSLEEKNTEGAFQRSFSLGFGTETDVRDCKGELVIAHDMPQGQELSLAAFLDLVKESDLPLAMNVKADGLAKSMAAHFKDKGLDWFVFDMSVPDMRMHLNEGNPVFARMSEVETVPAWTDEVQGIWLDAFEGEWYDAQFITSMLAKDKRICIVSPELHRRPHLPLWDVLRTITNQDNLMLCTDYPEEASRYFRESE